MSYTPTNWSTGDVITAEKLNNMESGIENAECVLVKFTTQDMRTFECDKTFSEIASALTIGKIVIGYVYGPDGKYGLNLVSVAVTTNPSDNVTSIIFEETGASGYIGNSIVVQRFSIAINEGNEIYFRQTNWQVSATPITN